MLGSHLVHAPEVPEWLSYLPPHALISSRDVCEIFGFKLGGLYGNVFKGHFPQPDMVYGSICKGKDGSNLPSFKNPSNKWRKSTILREIARRKILASQ